ncbi:InaA protein [Pseudomonas sp. 21C1]|nr:InaA protein [Pseudomonas sp. 21C1]
MNMASLIQPILPALTSEFDRWWACAGTWVEPANQRRGGESGVQLLAPRDPTRSALYCKRQTGHTYRSLMHPVGRPTALRERDAYLALKRLGISTPRLVYAAARHADGHWQALLVTEALEGFISLEQWYAQTQPTALTQAMLQALGGTLARLHGARWQHGCCYAKHLFIRVVDAENQHLEIALLDLEKSRRRWRVRDASRHDMRQLGRHCAGMPASDMQVLQQAYQQALRP